VLDIGAASGDMGASLMAGFPRAQVISLDRSLKHLEHARPPRIVADAFQLPFAARSFDFVFCSLFLHHFTNQQAIDLLRQFGRIARRAVIVIDLERNPLAYYFLPATRWLFRWHEITVHDGCISVQAAFRKSELRQLALGAGLSSARVRRHYPWFRLSMVAPV
jgi:ubiquinone/menaquinone biosynthesis C-methylase UbiE